MWLGMQLSFLLSGNSRGGLRQGARMGRARTLGFEDLIDTR